MLAHRACGLRATADPRRDALSRPLDDVEPLEEAIDVDGGDANRGRRLVEPRDTRGVGIEGRGGHAGERLERHLRRATAEAQRLQRGLGLVEQGPENDAPVGDLLHRDASRLLRVGDAQPLLEPVTEPAHRLVPHGAARAFHRVHVAVQRPGGLDRILARRQGVVDPAEAVGDLRRVLRAHEGVERPRDQIVRRHGPAGLDRGLAGGEARDRGEHDRRRLVERALVALANATIEALERGRELALAGEPGAPLQGMNGAVRAGDVARLRLERHEVARELLDEQPRELWIGVRHGAIWAVRAPRTEAGPE